MGIASSNARCAPARSRKSLDDLAISRSFTGTPENCQNFVPMPSTERMPRKHYQRSCQSGSLTPASSLCVYARLNEKRLSDGLDNSRSNCGSSYLNESFCGDEGIIDENGVPIKRNSAASAGDISRRSSGESMELTKEDYKLLRLTCEVIKRNAETIGLEGLKRMFEEMPNAVTSFESSPNRVIKKGESWELMGQGIMYLHALDKCLERVNRPKAFKKYVAAIVKRHAGYGVTSQDMIQSLCIFQQLIEATVSGGQSNVRFNYKDVRMAWTKFFSLLQRAVEQS